MDVESMTVSELKRELKSRDLKVGGKKAELKARLLEALNESPSASASTANTEEHPTDSEAPQTDFADFENYINDEYKKIADGNPLSSNGHDTDTQSVNIEEIISKNNASVTVEQEEEKNISLESDFDLQTAGSPKTDTSPTNASPTTATVTIPDFGDESKALNAKSKVEERRARFGTTAVMDEKAKIESRKRRFAAMNGEDPESEVSAKKMKIDKEAQRKKIFERAQKFGTKLPKNFKLTNEEAKVIHAVKIKRAERFGTHHMLPSTIQKAELDAKKAERMKRFQTGESKEETENVAVEQTPQQKEADKMKMMERKLRFGTLSEADKQQKRKDRFGDKTLDEIAAEEKAKGMMKKKKAFREMRNKQNFQQRPFTKGRGRGRGRRGGRGGRGRGFRGAGRGRGRGRGRARSGNQQFRLVNGEFTAEDQKRMNDRKLRFNQ